MLVVGWIIWALVAFMALTFPIGIYRKLKQGDGVQGATILQTVFLIIIAISFLIGSWNKLHIIWVTVLAMIISSVVAYSIGWNKGKKE